MSRDVDTLGFRIAAVRVRRGWTQRELAERADVSVPFLSGIENDKRNVSSEVLLRIADALDASLDYLVRGVEHQEAVREPETLPRALHLAAERLGWSYANVQAVFRAYRAVVAKRGGDSREWTEDDWVRLYAQFFGE